MDRRPESPEPPDPLTPTDGVASPEDELRLAFGKAIGFAAAALILMVGGGILLIVIAAVFFGFLFGS